MTQNPLVLCPCAFGVKLIGDSNQLRPAGGLKSVLRIGCMFHSHLPSYYSLQCPCNGATDRWRNTTMNNNTYKTDTRSEYASDPSIASKVVESLCVLR